MKYEDQKAIETALVEFILRVSRGETTSVTEVAILPEVVKVLKLISE